MTDATPPTGESSIQDAPLGHHIYVSGVPETSIIGPTGTNIWNAITRDYTDFPIYQFNVSNAFEVLFDVRVFNSLLGLTKDASNIQILSSSYDISNDRFANDSITLPFTNFYSQINSNTQISVGSLTNISNDFKEYVNSFYNEINSSTIYSFPNDFNPFNGVFDNATFTSMIIKM